MCHVGAGYLRGVTRVVSFEVADHMVQDIIAALAEQGFRFGASRETTTTVLDTFDGRIHRSGSRLELRDAETSELVLSGEGVVPAHLAVAQRPHVAADLPPGPFRSRIDALAAPRVLLPQLQLSMRRSTGVRCDAAGKTVAVVEVHEAIRIVDHHEVGVMNVIEVHEVAGYERQFRRAVAVLHHLRVTEFDGDTVTHAAAAVGVDLAGFEATSTVSLDPEMAAIDGYRSVLSDLATAVDANWEGAIDQTDVVFLHQLRIAVRRTRTVLGAAKGVLPKAVLGPAKAGFASLASATGPPRDLDVYLAEWERYIEPLGDDAAFALGPVRDLLEARSSAVHVELERTLRSEPATALLDGWRNWLGHPVGDEALPRRAERPLGALLAKRMEQAHTALIDKGRLIRPESSADQVHDLRKDAKKLRYLLECFGDLPADKPRKRYVKRLKALQDNLGEHQDAEVHILLLWGVAEELGDHAAPETIAAIDQLTKRLDHRRLAARAHFARRFADYDSSTARRSFDDVLETLRG
jgi:CHAD domain-containing protein